jgi:phage tail-like protein
MATRVDPYRGYRFRLEIDGIVAAGFSEVTGLEAQMQPEDYQEGGVNGFTHKLPTRFEYPALTLTRGLTDSRDLWQWVSAALAGQPSPNVRRTVRVYLGDPVGDDVWGGDVWGWAVADAYPVRWAGPELQADQGAVAVETIELTHHGITVMGE